MQVSFNPNITTNSNRQQNPNFKAVNMKWAKEIIEDPDIAENDFTFELLDRTSELTKVDFIDTISYTMDKVGEGFREGLQDIIEWAKKAEIKKVKKSA